MSRDRLVTVPLFFRAFNSLHTCISDRKSISPAYPAS